MMGDGHDSRDDQGSDQIMERAVPVNPVCAIDVPTSLQPRQVDLANHPRLPATGAQPAGTSGEAPEVCFEGFDELRLAVTGIMARVRQVTSGGSTLADLEEAVRQDLLTVGAAAVQDGLNTLGAAEVRRHDVTGPEGAPRPWADPGRTRTLRTLFGDVTFTRFAYRGSGVADVFPADEALDLPAGPSFSRALEARAAYLEALLPHRQVHDLIKWETGATIHTRQLRQIVSRAAADTATFPQTRAVPEAIEAPEPAGVPEIAEIAEVDGVEGSAMGSSGGVADGRVVVATFDGKGVVMRREALRSGERPDPGTVRLGAGLPGHEQQGYRRGRKRLAELSCVYDVAVQPRTVQEVIQALAGRSADPKAGSLEPPADARTPRARARWLQASLTATIDQVVADGFAQADRRDPGHRWAWLVLIDGNRSQIDAADAQATARGIHVPILIDLLHVLGYLGDAANGTFNPGAPAARTWFIAQARAVLEGHADQVAVEIRGRADRFRCTGTERKKVLAAATYLDNHLDHLDYPTALARGWPIATGVIEGACKNLVCDRMDVSGARWGLAGAGHVLDLRALVITDSFDEYRVHHLARQHARQYPKYTPAAA